MSVAGTTNPLTSVTNAAAANTAANVEEFKGSVLAAVDGWKQIPDDIIRGAAGTNGYGYGNASVNEDTE